MSINDFHMHYVCTPKEALELTNRHKRFWVSKCGCREGRGFCTRSRIDLCLMFHSDIEASGSGVREIKYLEVEDILREANEKHLAARPFRDIQKKSRIDGICFCCGYFLNKNEICDKGAYIESTIMDDCTHCGVCAEVCYFAGRKMSGGELTLHRENCYGCGLCRDICPEECIVLTPRIIENTWSTIRESLYARTIMLELRTPHRGGRKSDARRFLPAVSG